MERRKFLLGGAALGCSAAASPLLTPIALANAPWDNRLVVIVLRGGMDGLDVVRPVGDPNYAALRPTLNDGKGLDLNGFFAMHPALSPLMPLWQSGEVGAVHAVSTPYRDKRSHFDGQDILEAGTVDNADVSQGWLNRLMQVVPGVTAETAYAIGREQMLILTGKADVSRWTPEVNLDLSSSTKRLLEMVYHGDPLFRDAAEQAIEIAETIQADAEHVAETAEMMGMDPMMAAVPKNQSHVRLAEFAAGRLRGDTRIASFSIGGWDTHLGQSHGLPRALSKLSDTILALRSGLGSVWGKTGVICMTEFGRTAAENGTQGTDHGTGGAMIYAGGALRGGRVLGHWPGLDEADLYSRRDLMPAGDVRAQAAWVMQGLLGVNRDVIETAVFPGLDMGENPGILL